MRTLKGLDLMPLLGGALRGESNIIVTQTPEAAHAAIRRLLRGWKMRGTLEGRVWAVEGMLPGVSGRILVQATP